MVRTELEEAGASLRAYLLVITESAVAPEGTGSNNMSVSQDIASLLVNDKTRCPGIARWLDIESPDMCVVKADHAFYDLIKSILPL